MRALLIVVLLFGVPKAHAASAGAPPEEDASHWFEWVDDPSVSAGGAAVKAEESSAPSGLERIFAGSQLSFRAAAGSSSTLDQNVAGTISLFSLVDTSLWYAFNHPGEGLLARRFGGGVGVRPSRRTRIAFDYEHALPENQYGANVFWLSWTANVASGPLDTRLGASLGRLGFTDNSSVPLVNQTALRLLFAQETGPRVAFTGSYTYYSDPHGPVEADAKVRLLQAVIANRATNVNLEKPKTFEAFVNGRYLFNASNELLLEVSALRYFAGADADAESVIWSPGLVYTRLFGNHLSVDVSALLLLGSGQPANPTFGLQTTLTL